MPQRIVLDQATFKALATESRVAILKRLKERRYMQSELAELLGFAVPTVKEHLDAMSRAGLVIRIEEGRKWKYYELTPKGRALLEPEEEAHQLWIVLLVTLFAVLGGVVGFMRSLLAPFYRGEVYGAAEAVSSLAAPAPLAAPAADSLAAKGPEAADVLVKSATVAVEPSLLGNVWLWVYCGVVVVLLFVLVVKWLRYRRAKRERDALFNN